ncbi:MAG: hypothetical protein ABW204_06260 [Microbacteriaceae bacterium]
MTQWNDQAPLSRRQARERERQGDGTLQGSAVSAASAASAPEPEAPIALPFGAPAEAAPAQPENGIQPGSAVDASGERIRGRRASAASVDGAAAPQPASVASAAEPGLRRRDARVRVEEPASAAEPAPGTDPEPAAEPASAAEAAPTAEAVPAPAAPEPSAPSEPAAPPVASAYTASAAEPGSRRARRAAEQARVEPQAPAAESEPISDSQWAAVTQLGSAAEPGDRPAPSFWSTPPAREAAPQPVPDWAPPAQLPNLPSTGSAADRDAEPPVAAERVAEPPVAEPQAPAASEQPGAQPVPSHQPAPAWVAPQEPAASQDPTEQPTAQRSPADEQQPAVRRRGTWQAPVGDEPADASASSDELSSTAPQPFGRRQVPIADESAPNVRGSEPTAAPDEGRKERPVAETIVPPVGPGVGHWSRQSEAEDDTQSGTGAIGRGMGFASPLNSTNSLVLPSIPEPSNLTGPLGLTGEVLLTGSMELPRSLGSSGADPRRYDTSEVDRLFDQGDYEEVSTDSTPVLAARAISSHSATRGLVAAKKPRGSRGIPTALAIGAGVVALVVVGLFVVVMLTGGFTN